MHSYPDIPEYKDMPELSYRSRIAFRILQREEGFSIPDEDDKFIDWLIKERGIQPYQLLIPGCDRSQTEEFILQRIYSKFKERMEEDLSYEFFSKCLDAATGSCFCGPAPYCGFGIYSPFYHTCVRFGKSEPGQGRPVDSYSGKVATFFMEGLSDSLKQMPYHGYIKNLK